MNGYKLARKLRMHLSSCQYHLKELRAKRFVDHRKEGRGNTEFLTERGRQLLKLIDG